MPGEAEGRARPEVMLRRAPREAERPRKSQLPDFSNCTAEAPTYPRSHSPQVREPGTGVALPKTCSCKYLM